MARALHKVRFPGETPQYRRARNSLLAAEIELRQQIEAVAAKRRQLPLGAPSRRTTCSTHGRPVRRPQSE